METAKFSCIPCNFHTQYKQSLVVHEKSNKHKVAIGLETKKSERVIFTCECCNFNTIHKHVYQHHILSNKHKQMEQTIPSKQQMQVQVMIKPRETPPAALIQNDSRDAKIEMLQNQIERVTETLDKLTNMIGSIQPITNNNTINNTINIYFNKDLKYYPELVKLIGKEMANNLLLYKMPESKDLFSVLDKLFVKDGINTCPIRLDDGDEFLIARSETEFVHDPTGELIDKENKSKLQDAVMSAYISSTTHLDEECERVRKTRVNGSYTEEDEEVLNRRFEASIEPSRPYEIIDMIKNYKLKKKDFDRLRKICPRIVKKIVI